ITASQGGDTKYNAAPDVIHSFNIAAKHITGSFTANNKVYDGNSSATVATRSLSGVINNDDVTLTGGTATFSDKNVGNKTVTLTGAGLTGTAAASYILDSVATTTANITALHITDRKSTRLNSSHI